MPSTVIRSMRYDEESHTLSVWFVPSGLRYDYFDVPPEVFRAFRASGSKGRYFNIHIRDRYNCRQAPEPPASKPKFATIPKL